MRKLLIAVLFALPFVALAAPPKTVTLDVQNMTCGLCPITVKKALSKVKGVTKAEVSFEHKQAVVTFEDTQTSAGKLIEATTNAGYPSTLVETETP